MNIKEHLVLNGKTDSWVNLANQFGVTGNNKQKSDKVRKMWNKIMKDRLTQRNTVSPFMSTKFQYPLLPDDMYYSLVFKNEASNTQFKNQVDPSYLTQLEFKLQSEISKRDNGFMNNSYQWGKAFEDAKQVKSKDEWDEFNKWKSGKTSELPKKENGIHIVLSCIHSPFEDKKLIDKVLKFIDANKSKIIGFHLIGDYADLLTLSSHNEGKVDLSGITLGQEYKAGNLLLDKFDSVLPTNIEKSYIYGNHEDRYFRYISNIKNYLTADTIPSPTSALNLVSRGYVVKENWKEDYIQVGKYQLIHGSYCGTNPSKQHQDKLKSSVIFGHTHRVGQHYDGNLHSMNIGHLVDVNSRAFSYMNRVEKMGWKQGFGIVNIDGNDSQGEVIVVENGSFFYAGKKY